VRGGSGRASPWILRSDDLPKLEAVLSEADKRGLVAYDIMTERFEVTNALGYGDEISNRGVVGGGELAGGSRLHDETTTEEAGS
jgi:hypothetical protein